MSENTKKEVVKEEVKEVSKTDSAKKKISEKNLAVAITAGILALALIVLAVVFIVRAVKRDVRFDYFTSDLSKYIEFTEDYKNFKVSVDIAKPKDIDVDVTILNLICADKSEKPLYDGNYVTSGFTITPGDVVLIWYRGYLLDEDGEEIAVEGMSNFGTESAAELEIGGNAFIPGFELGLVGVNTGDYNKFEKITEGRVKENQVAYVTYTRAEYAEDKTKVTEKNVRIDLSEDVDAKYGEGFKAKLLTMSVGDKVDLNAQTADKTFSYMNLTVDFVTECENNPIKVETYFPYDYSKTELRNEKAIFEVYVEKAIIYDTPEFNDEYLTKKIEDGELKVTLEKLNEYEGDTLVAKYRAYAEELLEEIYQTQYDALVESAIWEHYSSIAKLKKLPVIKVEEMYNSYVEELNNYFINNGGMIYDSTTGQYATYSTLEEYAPKYFGLDSSVNWKEYVYAMAADFVKERLVLYYIMKTEGLVPSADALKNEISIIRQEYVDEYVSQYLDYEGKTKADYTDEEYNEMVAEREREIFAYYQDDHFEERAYYSIVAQTLITWPEVSTLDERRAYPVDK